MFYKFIVNKQLNAEKTRDYEMHRLRRTKEYYAE